MRGSKPAAASPTDKGLTAERSTAIITIQLTKNEPPGHQAAHLGPPGDRQKLSLDKIVYLSQSEVAQDNNE